MWTRLAHKTVATSTKTMYTIQVCCSAVGHYLPLYVVYKGKHLYQTWCNGGPEDARYNSSPSGWMEGAQFVEWFEKIYQEQIIWKDQNFLFLMDIILTSQTTVVNMAVDNNIELLCLPAHTSTCSS